MTAARTGISGPAQAASCRRALTAAAPLVALIAADLAFDPTRRHVPLCPLHAFTGLDCPFCGGLRALYSLAHGRVLAAGHDNLFVVMAGPFALAFWLDWWLRERSGRRPRQLPRWVTPVSVALAITFAVVRNLPFGRALSPV
jgi:hypothetical protein